MESSAALKETVAPQAATDDGSSKVVVCVKPDDLGLPASRALIGTLCRAFLDQLVITPTELLHSARNQSRLDGAGTLLRDLTEKAAAMQAKLAGVTAPQRARDLGDLFVKFALETRAIEEKEQTAPIKPGELVAVIGRIRAGSPDPTVATRRIGRSLTEYLAGARTWNEKLDKVIGLVSEAAGSAELPVLDQLLAETVQSDVAQDSLFGRRISIEDKIDDLVEMYKGSYSGRGTTGTTPAARDLAALLRAHPLPETRAALETAIVQILASRNPVRSPELMMELRATYGLVGRMRHQNRIIGGRRALEYIDRRMARLINAESVGDYIRGAATLADRVSALLEIYAVTFGPNNRKVVEEFLTRYFGDEDFERRLLGGEGSPQHKLKIIAQLHRAMLSSPMSPEDKNAYVSSLIKMQARFIASSKMFAMIEKQNVSSARKFVQVATLCLEGYFIPGENLERAKALARHYLGQPDFLERYVEGAGSVPARRELLSKLKQQLAALNIPAPFQL